MNKKPYVRFVLAAIAAFHLMFAGLAWSLEPAEYRQLLQMAEYIGVDYTAAVDQGRVVDEDEYQEMTEFSQFIQQQADSITESDSEKIKQAALALKNAVENKQDVAVVQKTTGELRRLLLAISPQSSLPKTLLPQAEVQALFIENCGNCHGETGMGNGLLAANLNPHPTDFTDTERAMNRSLLGLFDAISNGLDGTAMTPFSHLSDQQRWSLAFYVGGLAFAGKESSNIEAPTVSLEQWINYSPNALLSQQSGLNTGAVAKLRAQPQPLFVSTANPLAIARTQLEAARQAYRQGNLQAAQKLAVSAYLDGFELMENSLDARDIELRREIEGNLLNFRQVIANPNHDTDVDEAYTNAIEQLTRAEAALNQDALSSTTLFGVSFVILLREGLEALLVVLALVTVLIRTERKDALSYVHAGWVVALIAGAGTWLAAQTLIDISGASREIMEGVAALLAAVVLFYVGFWMHSKTNAEQWQKYIKDRIQHNLKTGTLWGLAGLSFLAVYREVFETVLFYESLLTQAASDQFVWVFAGFLVAAIGLALVALVMVRFSVRLPIGRFFSTTTYLLLGLSFILMGKAIAALQEAAIVGRSPLPVRIEFDWLGIYSTWQGISAQLLIVLLSAILMLKMRTHSNATAKVS